MSADDRGAWDVLPLTEELEHAILELSANIAHGPYGGGEQPSYSQAIDLPKIAVADAVLRALGLPTEPQRPQLLSAPTEGPTPRRKLPFLVRAKVMARDGFRCKRCPSEENLTIDHIVPLALGGTDDPENLQTLCGPCNSRKWAHP